MKVLKVLHTIKNIRCTTEGVSVPHYNLLNSGSKALADIGGYTQLEKYVGSHLFSEIKDSFCLYVPIGFKDEEYTLEEISEQMKDIMDRASKFRNCLWFVKDHSSIAENIYGVLEDGQIALFIYREMISSADGSYNETIFTPAEFEEAFQYEAKFDKIFPRGKQNDEPLPVFTNKVISPALEHKYKEYPRVGRAVTFLIKARSEGHLAAKISLYVGVLECLFTTDPSEVAHKVTERATLILGGSLNEKLENYKSIKKAYDLRSKYVHGAAMKNEKKVITHDYFQTASRNMDMIVRRILKLVIFEFYEKFENDQILEQWFKELLFS